MQTPAATTPRSGFDRPARTVPTWVLPAAIGAIALLLRLYGLGDKPFWLDEVVTLKRATASLHDLALDALHNRHYPSYFMLISLVAQFGHSPWVLRLPSALAGAVAAALTGAIGRRAAGSGCGVVAGLLMALSPFEVQFGQEARSYTLVSALVLLALWGLVRLGQEPAAAALPWRQSGLRGAWLAYTLGTAGALSVLGVAIPWLLASNLAAGVLAHRAVEARRAFLRQWGLAQLCILAAWAPSLAALLILNESDLLSGAAWAPAETPATVWATLAPVYLLRISDFITFNIAPAAVPGLSLVVGALAAFGAWRLRRERAVVAILLSAALVLPLTLLLLSPVVPLLVSRYFAWSAAPFFVLAAAGFARISWRAFAPLSTGLAAACFANLLPYYHLETKPRWDLAAKELAAKAKPGDVVLVDIGYAPYVFGVYAREAEFAAHGLTLARDRRQAQLRAPGHDVWALYGRSDQGSIVSPEEYLNSLAALGQPDAKYPIGRYITLYRFAVPPIGKGGPVEAARQ